MKSRDLVWSAVLVAGGAAIALVFLCIAPFAAAATLAVFTLSRRAALTAIAAMWLVNQAVGFGALHYPRDAATFGWGVAILSASLAAGFVATRLRPVLFAFVAAFGTYELVLFAWSLVMGEHGAFTGRIVAQVFVGNALGFAILAVLRSIVLAGFGEGRAALRTPFARG